VNEKEKLQQLFKEELIKELRNVYIKYDQKDLILFGEYRVKKTVDNLYEVTMIDTSICSPKVFNTVKTAVSYAVLHKLGDKEQAKKVVFLDQQVNTLDLEIKIHTKIYRNATDVDRKGIYLTKLQTDYIKKKQVLESLKTVINTSKYKQRNIFEKYIEARKKKQPIFDKR